MSQIRTFAITLAIMKMIELKQKSKEDLAILMREKQSRIDELRFLVHTNKVKNVKETAAIKKDIARIKTIISAIPRA